MRITEAQLRNLIVKELFNDLMSEQDEAEAGSALSTDEEAGEGKDAGLAGDDGEFTADESSVKLSAAVAKANDPGNTPAKFARMDGAVDERDKNPEQAQSLALFALDYTEGDLERATKITRMAMQALPKMAPPQEKKEKGGTNESVGPNRLKQIIQEEIFRHFMNK